MSNETDFDGVLGDNEEDRKGHKFIFCLDGYYIHHRLKETKRRRKMVQMETEEVQIWP